MDRETLAEQIDEALAHLNDSTWLANCPLAQALVTSEGGSGDTGAQLALILSAAIRELRPPEAQRAGTPEWRQYRYLLLRYILGAQPKQIAQELNVSERQARRDHQEALSALVDVLSRRYGQLHGKPAVDRQMSAQPSPRVAGMPSARREEAVQAEIVRLGTASSEGATMVEEAIRSVLATVNSLAASRQLVIETNYSPVACFVATDRAVLRQIVLNALLYLLERNARGSIQISVSERGRRVEVAMEVDRTGDETPVSRDGYVIVPTADDDRHLAIAARLLATQGGTLQVRGFADAPRLVQISLPAVWIAKVLVIDDNPDFVRLFQRYLGERAYRVYQANNGQKALQMALEVCPDVITVDVMMPSQDGWEILSALKSNPRTAGIPVIVCSVLEEESLARALGASEFLLKPVTQSDLLAALERCCAASPIERLE